MLLVAEKYVEGQLESEMARVQMLQSSVILPRARPSVEGGESAQGELTRLAASLELKINRIHLFNVWMKRLLIVGGLALLFFFLPAIRSVHLPLLTFLPLLNLLSLCRVEQEFGLRVLENKMAPFSAPADMDAHKMNSVENDFRIYSCQLVLQVVHLCTLLYVRGLNFNLFDLVMLGKAIAVSVSQMLGDLCSYLEYRIFLRRLNSRMITKHFTPEQEEICPICQETMKSGRQLVSCPHIYHQYCIVKFVQKGGHKCPMCRKPILQELAASHEEDE